MEYLSWVIGYIDSGYNNLPISYIFPKILIKCIYKYFGEEYGTK